MAKKFVVRLIDEERQMLTAFVSKGKTAAYKIKHANILLSVDADGPNWHDERVSVAFNCHGNTVSNVRKRFVEQGLDVAIERKKQSEPSRKRLLDGESEARLIALACRETPKGRSKWTLVMLADELVALNIVESISAQTVRRALKKTSLSPICVKVG